MRRLLIPMSEKALYRLAEVAEKERREPRQQAAYLLELALGIADDRQPPVLNKNSNLEQSAQANQELVPA